MCGFAGFQGDFQFDLLSEMGKRIAHRGPDDHGYYCDEKNQIGFAHRRLAIQDLSNAGKQPMIDEETETAIVFNGEIYNFRELKKILIGAGRKFRGNSDTEVLLQLYLEYGIDMLQKLNGIFSFAIWDKRRRKLFLVRDGFGVKPLYFAVLKEGVVFGSELKSILVHPEITREVNPVSIAKHLTYLWCPSPETAMSGINKLQPGYAVEIEDGVIKKKWQHYELPIGNLPAFCGSPLEAVEAVRDKFDAAVRRQLVSDVQIGAFLSGGLDSSAIVAACTRNSLVDIPCFTIEIDDVCDQKSGVATDLPFAKKVADHLDVPLNIVKVAPNMLGKLEKMIWHLDEPQADPAPLNALFISELAREKGIKVLLSGAGGDDIFTGYRRHWALTQESKWSWLPGALRQSISIIASHLPQNNSHLRRITKALKYIAHSSDDRIVSYFFWLDPKMSFSLMHPDIIADFIDSDVAQPLIDSISRLICETGRLEKMLFLDTKFFLSDHNLNYTDKMSMAAGVEVRVPFLDPELVSLTATLPQKFKQNGIHGKWILKKAMEPYLPSDTIYRKKTGFGAPLRTWLKNDLAEMVDDILSEKMIAQRGIFNSQNVRKLISKDRKGKIDAAYPIFAIMCTEIWCQLFIDNNGAKNFG